MSSPPEGIIDGHVHFWQRAEVDHPWLTADAGVIDTDFVPSDLRPHLAAAGVDRVVVVQSADSVVENRYLLDLAATTPWIAAVVGWAPLLDPRGCEELVAGLGPESRFVGVRHLVHTEDDPDWLARAEVTASLRILATAGLVFEIPAEFPLHLGHVPALAQAVPTLRIVVDHLGKPPVASGEVAPWRAAMERAAACPNVFAKVSGLNTVATPGRWTGDDLRPYVNVAIDLFGTERLLFGSDWPVLLLDGSYETVLDATLLALDGLAADELDRVMRGTACELYQLDDGAERSRTGGSAP